MRPYERSIKIAFDSVSGEIVEAEQVFDTKKNAFETRRQFHRNQLELYCCECRQKLNVSSSKYERLHFKHAANAGSCVLATGNLSPAEADEYTRVLVARESPRHKELKNKIAARLAAVEGVKASSITIDNKFIIGIGERRKPDVSCEYKGKMLVFEIQLSLLSLRYILDRYEFYQANGFYLVWILDKFDVHGQSQMVKDIKYLNTYQNFFKLDETVGSFSLECQYKFPYITKDSQIHTKWDTKTVGLYELSFDAESFQAYYFNFSGELAQKEAERAALILQWQEQQRVEAEKKRLQAAEAKAAHIIKNISHYKKIEWANFEWITEEISQLNDLETLLLNQQLDIKDKPAIYRWIKEAKNDSHFFLSFILQCKKIELSVNKIPDGGTSALQVLYQNTSILNKSWIAQLLFTREYNLTSDDKQQLSATLSEDDCRLFDIYTSLGDRSLVPLIASNIKVIDIIETAKQGKMVGYNYQPGAWLAFANNAIQYYGKYWNYIELAFKKFSLWEKIIAADKKGTFQQKLQEFYITMPDQSFDFDDVCKELYSELIT